MGIAAQQKSENEKNRIKISVVITVSSRHTDLERCLDSVLGQSLDEIEAVCVCDRSDVEALKILEKYKENDSRVKILEQEGSELYAARNSGIEAACGEFIHFLDACDYVFDYAYEALYNKMVKYDLDAARCPAITWNADIKAFVKDSENSFSDLGPGDFNRLLSADRDNALYKISTAVFTGICRRSFLLENSVRFPDNPICSDRTFFYISTVRAKRIMIVRDRLVCHRTGRDYLLDSVLYADSLILSAKQTADELEKYDIDMKFRECILRAEFNNLILTAKKFFGTDTGNVIMDRLSCFAGEYSGAFSYMLVLRVRDAQKHLSDSVVKAAVCEPEQDTILHEECGAPKVSVVVPTYNVEDYLNEALNSLTVQTLEEMEFICINDGSTDGSLVILKEYAALDKRFKILDGPNGGYGKGMNRGINAARGEYLGILEPDDLVPENMFGELYEIAVENDVDLVKADFYRFKINSNGSMSKNYNSLAKDEKYYGVVLCPGDDLQTFKFIMNTWSGIYKLEFLNKWNIRHNETPGASYQDNGFFFQTFCRAERAYFVNKPYYLNRRDNPNSSMFSRGKMNCVTEEYRFIWNWMQQDPELVKKFSNIYYSKKLDNFITTYRRLAPEFQEEYIRHTCDEFKGPIEQGLFDNEFSGENNWRWINEIIADPEKFYNRIRVSVIMPVYNAEKYIRQTLDSLLIRNELQFEIICVDDGSTDSSLEILREYEKNDMRVRVFTQENAGAGAARNKGMEYARGEYLSFLDADDFFESDMLRKAYEKAYLQGSDIIVFRSDQYLEDTGEFAPARYTINNNLLPANRPFAGAQIKQDVFKAFVGWAWDKLFRADFVRKNGLKFQEIRTTNDMLFVFSAILKAERISVHGGVLAHHRRTSGTLSVTREKSWDCFYQALCALRRQLKEWNLYDAREQDFINYCLHSSLWNLNSLRYEPYFKLYDKLKEEWLADLGITSHGIDYFYNRYEYQQFRMIIDLDANEYLFGQLNMARSEKDRALAEVKRQQTRANALKKDAEKQKRVNTELRAVNKKLRSKEKKLEKIYLSSSWRIGRAVTWIPRKIKNNI